MGLFQQLHVHRCRWWHKWGPLPLHVRSFPGRSGREFTGDGSLSALGDELLGIGDRWQELAELFKRGAAHERPETILSETTQPLLDIADREEILWRDLYKLVG